MHISRNATDILINTCRPLLLYIATFFFVFALNEGNVGPSIEKPWRFRQTSKLAVNKLGGLWPLV